MAGLRTRRVQSLMLSIIVSLFGFISLLPGWRILSATNAVSTIRSVSGSNGIDTGNCNDPTSPCAPFGYTLDGAVGDDTLRVARGPYVENLYMISADPLFANASFRLYLPILARSDSSPAAGWIAYIDGPGSVRLIRSDGSDQRLVTADGRKTGNFADVGLKWSPNGRLLAFVRKDYVGKSGQESLVVYDLDDHAVRAVVTEDDTTGFDWGPDSARLVYGRQIPPGYWLDPANPGGPIYGIWQVELATGDRSELVAPERGYPLDRVDWSPDGRFLLFEEADAIEGSGMLVIYDLQTKAYMARQIRIGSRSWAPDGTSLVYDEYNYYINWGSGLWEALPLGGNGWPLTTVSPQSSDTFPQFSPSGQQIAFNRFTEDQTNMSIAMMIIRADGSGERKIVEDVGVWFSWAPDDKHLAITKGNYPETNIYILDSEAGEFHWLVEGRSPSWQRETSTEVINALLEKKSENLR